MIGSDPRGEKIIRRLTLLGPLAGRGNTASLKGAGVYHTGAIKQSIVDVLRSLVVLTYSLLTDPTSYEGPSEVWTLQTMY